jgi:hypothetical protein
MGSLSFPQLLVAPASRSADFSPQARKVFNEDRRKRARELILEFLSERFASPCVKHISDYEHALTRIV